MFWSYYYYSDVCALYLYISRDTKNIEHITSLYTSISVDYPVNADKSIIPYNLLSVHTPWCNLSVLYC